VKEGLSQVRPKRESVIRAAHGRHRHHIAVNRGQSIAADAPLATVLPKGSGGLHAELLVPTRAIGLCHTGIRSGAAI
jgi:hypothetical protein